MQLTYQHLAVLCHFLPLSTALLHILESPPSTICTYLHQQPHVDSRSLDHYLPPVPSAANPRPPGAIQLPGPAPFINTLSLCIIATRSQGINNAPLSL